MNVSHQFIGGAAYFRFDGKPSETVRGILKRNRFRWSPANAYWWRNGVSGAADILAAIQSQIDRESGKRPAPVRACDCCGAPEGYWLEYGTQSHAVCDSCRPGLAHELRQTYGVGTRPEIGAVCMLPPYETPRLDLAAAGGFDVDRQYEDDCAARCGL